ncbi:hypothetical protein [Microlunatus sp. Gsoil 973]|uniref:hypothetical protein n=1 Tax=Microlunatus sp. Gsoil 973 TaxID=2672569 RepID=UPI0012B4C1E7|nr:hypothetical protein [Microlunatus sp. Gsoil 973]QGN33660.1 hypothetical protein GJV80_13530 [Microlunatus sp. Gsoil 973]
MATWEDGPEYAPLEQPAEFTAPDAPPLSVAEPQPEPPGAPAERPQFGNPPEHVAPLATLVPDIGTQHRDPHLPFEVDSDAMTQSGGGGAWGAAHWRPPTGPPTTGAAAPGPWGPPSGAPVAAPTDPMTLRSAPPSTPGGMPAPGTPAWFGPGPAAPSRPAPPPSLFRATPPGAIIVLALAIFWVIAPPAFLVAFVLAARARYARRRILTAFTVVGAVVLLIPTIDVFINLGDFGSWYGLLSTWSLLGSLLMIVLILTLVNTEIKNPPGGSGGGGYRQQPAPPYLQQRPDQRAGDQQWPPPGQ